MYHTGYPSNGAAITAVVSLPAQTVTMPSPTLPCSSFNARLHPTPSPPSAYRPSAVVQKRPASVGANGRSSTFTVSSVLLASRFPQTPVHTPAPSRRGSKDPPKRQEKPEEKNEPDDKAIQLPATLSISGKSFHVDKVIGKGSFGVVYKGYERTTEDVEESDARKTAVKQIVCRSERELKQAEFEGLLLQRLSREMLTRKNNRGGNHMERVACPALLAMETVRDGSQRWRVRIAMELVPGMPLDDFLNASANRRNLADTVQMGLDFLRQMRPTLERVATVCVHRDINPHNIMFSPAGPEQGLAENVFTLIDFGLAADASDWRSGEWQRRDIGGDCRYWPVSAWKQLLFGYKYLTANPRWMNEYVHNLDVHSIGLTGIELLVSLVDTDGTIPAEVQRVIDSWKAYWEAAYGFWEELFGCFRAKGDFNALKKSLLQKQVAEKTETNLARLRKDLLQCVELPGPDSAAFFKTLAQMISGEPMDMSQLFVAPRRASKEISSTTAPAQVRVAFDGDRQATATPLVPVKRTHRRQLTFDADLLRDVPEVGLMPVPGSAAKKEEKVSSPTISTPTKIESPKCIPPIWAAEDKETAASTESTVTGSSPAPSTLSVDVENVSPSSKASLDEVPHQLSNDFIMVARTAEPRQEAVKPVSVSSETAAVRTPSPPRAITPMPRPMQSFSPSPGPPRCRNLAKAGPYSPQFSFTTGTRLALGTATSGTSASSPLVSGRRIPSKPGTVQLPQGPNLRRIHQSDAEMKSVGSIGSTSPGPPARRSSLYPAYGTQSMLTSVLAPRFAERQVERTWLRYYPDETFDSRKARTPLHIPSRR